MKKALLGRRLFTSLMPAAPVMAGEIGKNVVESVAASATKTFKHIDQITIKSAGWTTVNKEPANYSKYLDAEHKLNLVREFRYKRNRVIQDVYARDPNIMALKSVSSQHKAMMHVIQEEREYTRNHTFLEQLKDALGLREYFKNQADLYAGSEPAMPTRDYL